MVNRVTQATVFDAFQRQVSSLQRRLASAQETIATQKRLREASADPAGADRLLRARSEQGAQKALATSVRQAADVLRLQDPLLDEASRLLDRAREIASQQASGLIAPSDRQAAAEEVEHIQRSLLEIANSTQEGRRLFGGMAAGAEVFTPLPDPPGAYDPTIAYVGPAADFSVEVGPNERVLVATDGSTIFGGAPGTPGALEALDALRTDLEAGADPSARLAELSSANETLLRARASVGARLSRLETRSLELTREGNGTEVLIGSIEDADLSAAITEMTQLQNAYQATLASVQVLRTSLLDVFQP